MSWGSGDGFGHEEALMHLVSWLRQHQEGRKLVAIGHRVVHGGEAFSGPVLVDDAVVQALEALVPLAPLHQPHNLEPIRIVRRRLPGMPQVACFDTAFHQSQSDIARCSPCRARCASAACGATASTASPTTTSHRC